MEQLKTILQKQKEILTLTAQNKIYDDCFNSIACIRAEGCEFMTRAESLMAIDKELHETYKKLTTHKAETSQAG